MDLKGAGLKCVCGNRNFLLFLVSQGISNVGDAFQLVAVVMLLHELTGSGLAAGFALICAPLPGIVISLFAGAIGDKFQGKYILVAVDLLRALNVILFVLSINICLIYVLLLTLSSLNSLYNPSAKKLVAGALRSDEIVAGNSLLTGVSGLAYLFSPVASGFIIGIIGINSAFVLNCISFVMSALFIALINEPAVSIHRRVSVKIKLSAIYTDVKEGFCYCAGKAVLRDIILTNMMVAFSAALVNIAFYPYSLDTLKVTATGWGLILSVYNGASLAAVYIATYFIKKTGSSLMLYVYPSIFAISIIWYTYGMVDNLAIVLLLLLAEGITASVCGILLTSGIQILTGRDYMSRMAGISDIAANTGRLGGIGTAYILVNYFSYGYAFAVASIPLFLFSAFKFLKMLRVPRGSIRSNRM